MKRNIYVLFMSLVLFIFLGSIKVFAADFSADAKVDGEVKKGQNIKITFDIYNIKSLYAADIIFKYDNKVLKIDKFELGDLISDKSISTFVVPNIKNIDNDNGVFHYEFSCLGKMNGYSGSGKIVILDAEVLQDKSFFINSKAGISYPDNKYNLKLELLNRNITSQNFDFSPYGKIDDSIIEVPVTNSGSSVNSPGSSNLPPSDETGTINNNNSGTKNPVNNKPAGTLNNSSNIKPGAIQKGGNSDANTDKKTKIKTNKMNVLYVVIISICILIITGAIGLKVYRKKKVKNDKID